MANILIVEDDKKLNDGICLALKSGGHIFCQCRNLRQARDAWKTRRPDLILLDVNLPDGSGIDFLKELRADSQVPVIILTANNMELDIVTGLESGADDYITKPFSLMVLRARVDVQLRKKQQDQAARQTLGAFSFDFEAMRFAKNGMPIELSKTEQKLLRLLVENRGATMSRGALIDRVWDGDAEFVDEHALTVSIKRLRDKLEDDSSHPRHIKTVYGIGYTWADN
ncbi:MAG: response regulator transcription factor [Firmicutes bacterium]|jgi:DNA-binding response OmpR family regulator|nr:response regulator transcription factor [Bacillota bacterium]